MDEEVKQAEGEGGEIEKLGKEREKFE